MDAYICIIRELLKLIAYASLQPHPMFLRQALLHSTYPKTVLLRYLAYWQAL